MILTAKSPAIAHACPVCKAPCGTMCFGGERKSQRNTVHNQRAALAAEAIQRSKSPVETLAAIDASIDPPAEQLRDHIRRTAVIDLVAHPHWGWAWPRVWPKSRASFLTTARSTAASATTVDALRRLFVVVAVGHKCKMTELGRKVAALIEEQQDAVQRT